MNLPVIIATLVWTAVVALAGLACLPLGALMLIVLWPLPVFTILFAALGHAGPWLAGGTLWMWAHTQAVAVTMETPLCRWAYYPEDYPRARHLAARGAMWTIYGTWWAALGVIVWCGRTWLR